LPSWTSLKRRKQNQRSEFLQLNQQIISTQMQVNEMTASLSAPQRGAADLVPFISSGALGTLLHNKTMDNLMLNGIQLTAGAEGIPSMDMCCELATTIMVPRDDGINPLSPNYKNAKASYGCLPGDCRLALGEPPVASRSGLLGRCSRWSRASTGQRIRRRIPHHRLQRERELGQQPQCQLRTR
jgi:hypothetical protein